jgi:dTDP-4-amino-4,6-dideoxygalactose transaminase
LCSDFESNTFNSSDTPIAKKISDTILCLPIYSDLEPNDARKIAAIVKDELKRMKL